MKTLLDANIVVRYLGGIPEDQAERVRALLGANASFWLTETVLLETAFILEKQYNVPRLIVLDGLLALLREPHILMHGVDKVIVIQGLLYCRPSRRVSLGDALIWAAAYEAGGEIYTFDRRFPNHGVTVLEP